MVSIITMVYCFHMPKLFLWASVSDQFWLFIDSKQWTWSHTLSECRHESFHSSKLQMKFYIIHSLMDVNEVLKVGFVCNNSNETDLWC